MSSAFPRCSTADDLVANSIQVLLHPVCEGQPKSAPAEVAWISRDARWGTGRHCNNNLWTVSISSLIITVCRGIQIWLIFTIWWHRNKHKNLVMIVFLRLMFPCTSFRNLQTTRTCLTHFWNSSTSTMARVWIHLFALHACRGSY